MARTIRSRSGGVQHRGWAMRGRLMKIASCARILFVVCSSIVVPTFVTARTDGRRSWCDAMKESSASAPRTSVDLGWSGSDSIDIGIPARVQYRPGPKAEATVTGNADLASHVRLRDGQLEWDSKDYEDCYPTDLVVHLVGPPVAEWTIHGTAHLDLNNIRQDVLKITRHGIGRITADGDVRETWLRASGRGSADLGRLETQRATIRISGSGEVDVAPREDADISISGRAVLRIHGNGAKLHIQSHGRAQVIQVQ